jgi:hypothetical protein
MFNQLISSSQVMVNRVSNMINYIDRIVNPHAKNIATLKNVQRTILFAKQPIDSEKIKLLFFPKKDINLNKYVSPIKHIFAYS